MCYVLWQGRNWGQKMPTQPMQNAVTTQSYWIPQCHLHLHGTGAWVETAAKWLTPSTRNSSPEPNYHRQTVFDQCSACCSSRYIKLFTSCLKGEFFHQPDKFPDISAISLKFKYFVWNWTFYIVYFNALMYELFHCPPNVSGFFFKFAILALI